MVNVLFLELILDKIRFLVHYLLNLMHCLPNNNVYLNQHHQFQSIDEIQYLTNLILLDHLVNHNRILVGIFIQI